MPWLTASSPPTEVRERPSSNCPASERAKKKIPEARTARKTGDWSWKPHPAWVPPARRMSRTATIAQKGDEDAEGSVDLRAQLAAEAATLLGGLNEREAFEEEDGEDAGHQVEDDAAEEGEANGAEGGKGAGGSGASIGLGDND